MRRPTIIDHQGEEAPRDAGIAVSAKPLCVEKSAIVEKSPF